jgi:hypothetical protein
MERVSWDAKMKDVSTEIDSGTQHVAVGSTDVSVDRSDQQTFPRTSRKSGASRSTVRLERVLGTHLF